LDETGDLVFSATRGDGQIADFASSGTVLLRWAR
jgi:hypothetical protein